MHILVAGGEAAPGSDTALGEIFDGKTGSFKVTSSLLSIPRESHQCTLLQDGSVLVTGGFSTSEHSSLDVAEVWSATTGFFLVPTKMVQKRYVHGATCFRRRVKLF